MNAYPSIIERIGLNGLASVFPARALFSALDQTSVRIAPVIRFSILALFTLALNACSVTSDVFQLSDVKPWERGTLARDDMQPISDAMDSRVDDHIYFSKEGSTGGSSVKGGGCGCN